MGTAKTGTVNIISNFIKNYLNIMKRKYITIAGKKFYCDEKANLEKDADGNFVEVAENDTTAEEVSSDDATTEVAKMLEKARQSVLAKSDKDLTENKVKAIEAIDGLFKGIADAAKKNTKITTGDENKASFDVDEVNKGIADLASHQRSSFSFTIKSRKDLAFLTKSTAKDDLTGDVIQPDLVSEITRAPARQIFMESIADVNSNMTSDSLAYVECVTQTGAPASTAELATMPEKDFAFQEFKAPLKKITVTNKHSVEILNDASQLVNAIKGWLNEDINIETDQQLLTGNGTGANLQGVVGVASILNAASIGTKRVVRANLADVIRLALTKVAVSGKGKFQANYVLLNPVDADQLDLDKDVSGQYVLPPFRSMDGTMIKGARIIENVGITADTFLVGDFRKLHVGTKGGVEIEMTNSDGTDFVKDILTVKLRRRMAAYVRQNDSGAFWTGTISTIKAYLVS